MRRLRILVVLLLATVWLPATLHCGLEAAGFFEHADACCEHADAGHERSAPCSHDACGLVESGDYQPAQNFLKVSAPSAVLLVFCLTELAPELRPAPEIAVSVNVESPPEIRRTWQFASRAALSPRAPSFVC